MSCPNSIMTAKEKPMSAGTNSYYIPHGSKWPITGSIGLFCLLGGFASIPIGLAAWRLGIPIVLLEQNTVPGRANRLLSRFARVACLSFESSKTFLSSACETVLTGNPVRHEFRVHVVDETNDQAVPKTLLVLGGSQGACQINKLI